MAVYCDRVLRFLDDLQERVELRFRRDTAVFEKDIVMFYRATNEFLRIIRLSIARTILVVSPVEPHDGFHVLFFEYFDDRIPDPWTSTHVPWFLRVLKGQ
jgi:hypothetical protein